MWMMSTMHMHVCIPWRVCPSQLLLVALRVSKAGSKSSEYLDKVICKEVVQAQQATFTIKGDLGHAIRVEALSTGTNSRHL